MIKKKRRLSGCFKHTMRRYNIMRLYKKAAAVLLAAVMAVSMLTACGGGGGSGSGGSGSGTGGSGTGGSGSGSGTGTGTGSNTGYSTDFDETTTGGTASKILEDAQPISYFGSKAKTNFSGSYTYEFSGNFGDYGDQTGNFEANMMATTDGNRSYSGGTGKITVEGLEVTTNTVTLTDQKANKEWIIDLDNGTYKVQKYMEDNAAFDKDLLQRVHFYKGKYKVGSQMYDAEAFSVVATSEGIPMTMTFIYCYEGNTPKYIIGRGYALGGLYDDEALRITIKNFSTKARTEFLDFENILSKYKPAS